MPDDAAARPSPATPAPPAPSPQPTAPKHPGSVTLTIDGIEVVAKPGTNLIEAANQVDVDIPFYCYHRKLTIAANCRMCLVKVSNSPKLVPACQTPVTEGLKVVTQSAEVMDSHRSVQELLLYNHPVDCAICDQAGECKLQDYYMQYDHKPYRPAQPKVLRHKRKELGPLVLLDQERCILCTRCVRFMREVPKEPQLGVFGRGNREYIDIFPGVPLTSKYAGNTVDICPVGALLSRDFRFKARAFFLTATPSICAGCSRGCNSYLDHYDQVSYRYRPRENDAVNQSWMCDDGRLTYHRLNENRQLTARIGRGAQGREASIAETVEQAVAKLKPLVGQGGLAALVSPQLSVEDLLLTLVWIRDGLKLTSAYVGGYADGDQDDLLIRADKNPNRQGLVWIAAAYGIQLEPFTALTAKIASGEVRALYAAGLATPTAMDLGRLELTVGQSFHTGPLAETFDYLLPAAPHAECDGTFVNFQGRAQRFQAAYPPSGDSRAHWRLALDLLIATGFASRYKTPRELFLDLAPRVPQLATVNWDDLGPEALQKPGLGTAAAGADARPPGYRERLPDPTANAESTLAIKKHGVQLRRSGA